MKIYFCAGGIGKERAEILVLRKVDQLHSYYAIICDGQRFGAKEDFDYLIDTMKEEKK